MTGRKRAALLLALCWLALCVRSAPAAEEEWAMVTAALVSDAADDAARMGHGADVRGGAVRHGGQRLHAGRACGAQQGDTTTTEAPTESVTESTTSNLNGNFVFTKENYPRMGGSLANLPLGQAVTATVLGISREDANELITFAGSTTDKTPGVCRM